MLVACVSVLAMPARAAAVSYGIADAPSSCAVWGANSCNSWGYGFASYSGGGAFSQLKNSLPLGYVRFFAPYDSVYVADAAGACRWSSDYTSHRSIQYPDGGGPGSAWFRLAQEIRDAQAAGLQPLVALTTATSAGQQLDGVPATPDPTAGGPGGPSAVTTAAGQDYACGVQGLTYQTQARGLAVEEWEAWNEPDASPAYNGALDNACASLPNSCGGIYAPGNGLCGSTGYTRCGPLEAAGLYAILSSTVQRWQSSYGWPLPAVAAGTLSWPTTEYLNAYLNQLTTVLGQWPEFLSYHAYGDVTSARSAQSYALAKDIFNTYADAGRAQPSIWITESGVVLTDSDRSYDFKAIDCDNGEADDTGTLAACVDGNPTAQRTDADQFLNLAGNGAYVPGQITQVYWYQFQPANASSGWDSGLLAPPQGPGGSWAQVSPDGIYGSNGASTGLRPSFCVLAHLPGGDCGGSVEASDWSVQPRTVSGSLKRGGISASGISGDQSPLGDGAFVTGPGIAQWSVISSGAGTSSWSLSNPAIGTGTENITASG